MKKLLSSVLVVSVAMSITLEASQVTEAPSTQTLSVGAPTKISKTTTEAKKPVQHLKVADITSMDDAVKAFNESVTKLKSKTKFNATELHEIHIITYSTEKAVAYFAENLPAEQKELAKNSAIVLEKVHLASESNKKEATQKNLTDFLALADKIAKNLK